MKLAVFYVVSILVISVSARSVYRPPSHTTLQKGRTTADGPFHVQHTLGHHSLVKPVPNHPYYDEDTTRKTTTLPAGLVEPHQPRVSTTSTKSSQYLTIITLIIYYLWLMIRFLIICVAYVLYYTVNPIYIILSPVFLIVQGFYTVTVIYPIRIALYVSHIVYPIYVFLACASIIGFVIGFLAKWANSFLSKLLGVANPLEPSKAVVKAEKNYPNIFFSNTSTDITHAAPPPSVERTSTTLEPPIHSSKIVDNYRLYDSLNVPHPPQSPVPILQFAPTPVPSLRGMSGSTQLRDNVIFEEDDSSDDVRSPRTREAWTMLGAGRTMMRARGQSEESSTRRPADRGGFKRETSIDSGYLGGLSGEVSSGTSRLGKLSRRRTAVGKGRQESG